MVSLMLYSTSIDFKRDNIGLVINQSEQGSKSQYWTQWDPVMLLSQTKYITNNIL